MTRQLDRFKDFDLDNFRLGDQKTSLADLVDRLEIGYSSLAIDASMTARSLSVPATIDAAHEAWHKVYLAMRKDGPRAKGLKKLFRRAAKASRDVSPREEMLAMRAGDLLNVAKMAEKEFGRS